MKPLQVDMESSFTHMNIKNYDCVWQQPQAV
jgi:hypothetical protein